MKTKIDRLFSFLVGLFTALYALTVSIFTIINDVNNDLSRTKQVVGRVIYADVREIRTVALRWATYHQVFYLKLNNSNQNFAVYNSYEGYSDLQSNIKVGDTIKVFYGSTLLETTIATSSK